MQYTGLAIVGEGGTWPGSRWHMGEMPPGTRGNPKPGQGGRQRSGKGCMMRL